MKFRVGKKCFAARDIAQAETHCENVEFDAQDLEVEKPTGSRTYVPVAELSGHATLTVDEEETTD